MHGFVNLVIAETQSELHSLNFPPDMDAAKTIVVGNKTYRPLLDDQLTPEDIRVAREELNETENSRAVALKTLKERLSKETELVPETDDAYLLRFLRARKFDCERALKLMKEHYKLRAKHPAVFPAPSSVEKALRSNFINYLPHRDHLGRAVCLFKIGLWDPDEIPFFDMVAATNIVAEYIVDNPVTQINGFIGIWDYTGFSFKQFVPLCSPKRMWLVCNFMQDRFPARFKTVYNINCHNLVYTAWSLFKPFIKEKFRNRVKIICGDMKDLHQTLDPAVLPVEYGGVQPLSDNQEIVDKIMKMEHYYNYNRKFGYQTKDKNKNLKE